MSKYFMVEFEECEAICEAAEKVLAEQEQFLKDNENDTLADCEKEDVERYLKKVEKCMNLLMDYGRQSWLDKTGDWQHGTGFGWIELITKRISNIRNDLYRPRTADELIEFWAEEYDRHVEEDSDQ